ncbi:hypothetical protein [Microbispora rosea]
MSTCPTGRPPEARDPEILPGYWVTGRSGTSWSGKLVDNYRFRITFSG